MTRIIQGSLLLAVAANREPSQPGRGFFVERSGPSDDPRFLVAVWQVYCNLLSLGFG